MGRYEDLVKLAKEGDASALDALETEFSGTTLRDKAEKAESLQAKLEANLPLIRKAKLADLMEQLDDALKDVGLTADDFKDVDPDDLTLEMVSERAKSRADALQESRLSLAKGAGFDTVEEFETAIQAVKQRQDERVQGMETVGAGVASSGGSPSSSGGGDEDIAKDAFESAKKEGKSDDIALGRSIDALIEAQLESLSE